MQSNISALRGTGVAVLIPCYNEAATIAKVVGDFRTALPEATIYVYDNASTDDTAAVAAAAGAVVRHESRQGKGNVVRSMFRDIDADYYLMVDGDDTYPAQVAQQLLVPIIDGDADMVVGDRISNGSYDNQNGRRFHKFGNNLVRWLIRLLYGHAPHDVMTGYRAFSRAFVKTMPVMSQGFQIETEISIWAVDHRWRVIDVPVDYRDRPEGSESKLSTFTDGMLVLAAIVSLFRDYRPMAFFGWVSVILIALGLIAGVPVIAEYFDTGFVSKLPSAVLAVAFMLCAALSFAAGLILDMVAKSNRRRWELEVYRVMGE
ncbi:MAG: glycosyltransferase family 2 protein [Coriobacteriales bacterium]